MPNIGRVLREPLLHFLLIGLALFLYYGHLNPGGADERRIVVTQSQVDDLERQFQATWNRPATPQEISSLVESYVHDEILFREGEALGLGRDDVVIKRRVRQKLDVMAEEEIGRTAPTDAELAAYLKEHPQAFEQPESFTFRQIYFAASGSDADIDRALAAARAALDKGADPKSLGQATMLPAREEGVTQQQIARDFGEQFAAGVVRLPTGEWSGPVVSSFGVHLVRVELRQPAVIPPLDAVRAQVAREWENERRKRALDEAYARLRGKYQVVISAKLPGPPPT